MLTRREMTSGFILGLGALSSRSALARSAPFAQLPSELKRIEGESGGRLGVAVFDTMSGVSSGYRADERFPLCSTFKVLAAAAVLTEADRGKIEMSRRIVFTDADVVVNSPITKSRTGGAGMTLSELCAAAIDYSDNTAGNMLLRQIGGPIALTRYARSIGDTVTRLDRVEPDLNEALPGDERDTTTPASMLVDLRGLLVGSLLKPGSRDQLIGWLEGNTTGGARLRARLPAGWRVGDKTGSGDRGATNDIGALWFEDDKPLLVAVYLTGTQADADTRNATIAKVGKAIVDARV